MKNIFLVVFCFLLYINIGFSKDFYKELITFQKALKLVKKQPNEANILIKKVLAYHDPITYNDALVVYAYLNKSDINVLKDVNPRYLTRGFVYQYYRLLYHINPDIIYKKPCFFQDKENLLYQNQEAIKNALEGGCYFFAYKISKDSDSVYANKARFYYFLFTNNFDKAKDVLGLLKGYKDYDNLKSFYTDYIYKHLFFEDKPKEVIAYSQYVKDGFYKYFYEGISYFELKNYNMAKNAFLKASKYDDKGASYYWLYKTTHQKRYLELASKYDDFYGTMAKLKLGIPIKTHFLRCNNYKIDKKVLDFKKAMNTGFNSYIFKYYLNKPFTKEELCAIFHIDPKFYIEKKRDYNAYPIVFLRYIPKNGVSPYLVLSIIRRESFYNPIARTYWAFPDKKPTTVGLMQVKKSTAKFVADKFGLSFNKDMKNPKNSILYGSYYLKFLESINKDPVKVIASYNAGPGNVSRYEDFPDELLFIEHIKNPINRRYVKYVLNYYWHYKYGK